MALLLDAWLGEPRRAHPLVIFGAYAMRLEEMLNPSGRGTVPSGLLAVGLAVVPWVALAAWLLAVLPAWAGWAVSAGGLYAAIALRSLREHARDVSLPLQAGDLVRAREQVARIVSRDTQALDAEGVARAATESVLENGADALFASLFWFLVAGLPGVMAHRLVNTLDAMWGYRTPRYLAFGRVAARLDDLLNWVPARLTALGYALAGDTARALRCWRTQARDWKSPNAGPVMAAGAGALGLQLGGVAIYHGAPQLRPPLGEGAAPDARAPLAAIRLVQRSLWCWLATMLMLAVWL
ncbi:cobalamin biosynthesis protein [Alcanivorax sp. S71-1-4]|uniref:adenosylcobinamide-phosphate synthase CbiB n=1 Tax=Alcanivorax sp. S71-1-4 TaxID=1177159 RepID=UPI0016AB051B|nr:adenosylcobinamide-phosphate synthase CbiB [Alcanivorax sp. S71-1-4]KAF0810122.1 cobalamin biosynthesis protein [Alcanivorax sp. S71-1-4]